MPNFRGALTDKDVDRPMFEPNWKAGRLTFHCRALKLIGGDFARNWFHDSPDIFDEDLVSGGVGMNTVRQIKFRVSSDALQ